MTDDLYDGPCGSGCQRFHGGETRHKKGCGHYPESLTKVFEDSIAALQAENAKLREALNVIATHRAKCHEYDTDCGHEKRSFDEEDVRLMEWQAKSALSGQDAEGET